MPAEDVKHIGTLACARNTKQIPCLDATIFEHKHPLRFPSNEDAFGCLIKSDFADQR